jgi:hypothetical protein
MMMKIPAIILASVLVVAALLFFMTPPVQESTPEKTGIYRSFSATSISPGDILTVNLEVVVAGGEDHYLIEEYVPEGWVVKIGNMTSESGRLTFYKLQNPENKTYKYKAIAPSQPGPYEFYGFYMFQGMEVKANTSGQANITVV